MNRRTSSVSVLAITSLVSACSGSHAPSHAASSGAAPATLVAPTTLDGLATVTLTEDSMRALGVEVAAVTELSAAQSLHVGGEVMVPAGRDIVLAAPTSGRIANSITIPRPGESVLAGQTLLSFVPLASIDRDVRARATRELDTAVADNALAEARLTRATAMAAERSGSERSVDEARALAANAVASVRAAQARLQTLTRGALDSDLALPIRSPVDGIVRALRITPGQSVPQGAPLVEIAGTGRWVRASFAAGDSEAIASLQQASATRLGSSEAVTLAPLQAPPSADPLRGTVDRFFALPADNTWTPGERVSIEVVAGTERTSLAVPWTSVVRDAEGGTWVYVVTEAHSFRRRRVEIIRRVGDQMLLLRGPAVSTPVVSVGAAELWGFELGADR